MQYWYTTANFKTEFWSTRSYSTRLQDLIRMTTIATATSIGSASARRRNFWLIQGHLSKFLARILGVHCFELALWGSQTSSHQDLSTFTAHMKRGEKTSATLSKLNNSWWQGLQTSKHWVVNFRSGEKDLDCQILRYWFLLVLVPNYTIKGKFTTLGSHNFLHMCSLEKAWKFYESLQKDGKVLYA